MIKCLIRRRRLALLQQIRRQRNLDRLERRLEYLRDRATGIERIRCINDLYRMRMFRGGR